MNAPLVKNALLGSHDAVLILRFVHDAPSSVETASNVSIMWFAGSRRQSSQIATNRPSGPAATHGKNWSLAAGLPAIVVLSQAASLHVVPPSFDTWYEMLVAEFALSMAFWYVYTRVPVVGL